ncbi:Uncharacterised protein [Metamycoplasma cloacale]|uniref:Uncharacterized protein n=1 Tax=Metamycoplasma cloacale TaxID=92401 RepID=A0A2Z4LLL0_9BACT|nr:hypothetical protein [Metamycoplasma cloacale]AWX42613.1 hypothetical protein DK849_00745 [Metamycoplasma cloacale]VEU79636.1 Uncharacterised protein [Metamycoplasma cloacale]
MENLYILIARLIQEAQYIQHNIALIVTYSDIWNKYQNHENITVEELMSIHEQAWLFNKELAKCTLGRVIWHCQNSKAFSKTTIALLYEYLKIRNYYAHEFFIHNHSKLQNYDLIVDELKLLNKYIKEFQQLNYNLSLLVNEKRTMVKTIKIR